MIQTGFDPDVLAVVVTVMCETHLGRGVSTAEVQEQASEVLEATRAYLTEVGA